MLSSQQNQQQQQQHQLQNPLHSILQPSKTSALARAPSPATHLDVKPLVLPSRQHRDFVAFTLQDILTPQECQSLIERSEQIGYEIALVNAGQDQAGIHAPGYRDSLRALIDDPLTAAELWARVKHHVPAVYQNRPVVGMNERLRFLKYSPGDQFQPHMDGEYRRRDGSGQVTMLTIQFYLNEGCEGGATTFLDENYFWKTEDEQAKGQKLPVECKVGQALIFQHDLVHEGSKVLEGVKYVIRSDILYGPASY
ncbi:hypothetical protein BGZ72_002313 [Mortierella alpina]|nr:hypothetical protein BGZ72_002313 [Mortierella alpina]